MERGNNFDVKSQHKTPSQRESGSSPSSPPPPSPPYPPSIPPPIPPTPYYPPQPPPPVYSWEVFPHIARELIQQKGIDRTIFVIISVFLVITAALEFPIAGLFAYYASSEGLDFGDTLTLEGNVQAEDGTNLSGVRISIVGTYLSSVSDVHGNYRIRNAPTGVWRIKASITGYKEETHKVLIHHSLTETVDFRLEEGSGTEESNDLWFFLSLTILMVMFSFFIIAGSFYAFKRKRFSVVLVGAILGLFTMSPPIALWFLPSVFIMGMIGFILSFLALMMIVITRKAFIESGQTPSQKEDDEPV